jgi:hypothetical protein
MSLKKTPTEWFTCLFLLILRPVVYSGSSFLATILLSLYGLVYSVTIVPRKRLSGAKSLLKYGVAVVQKKLATKE